MLAPAFDDAASCAATVGGAWRVPVLALALVILAVAVLGVAASKSPRLGHMLGRRARRALPVRLKSGGDCQAAVRGPRHRILLVNHGYPPTYNAGSEIYTQTLANALHAAGHAVALSTRCVKT